LPFTTFNNILRSVYPMGVDYNIHPVIKKPNGEVESIKVATLPHLSWRYSSYRILFRDSLEKIEKLANTKLDLDFYEKPDGSGYGDETHRHKIYNPEEVKSTIKLILGILKENTTRFPYYYWISFKGQHFMFDSETIFLGDDKVYLIGGWDKCYYMLNDKIVDLTKEESEFSAYCVLHEKLNDKYIDKKGGEIIVLIKKRSLYEFFSSDLNDIIIICDYAIEHNYSVQGYLG